MNDGKAKTIIKIGDELVEMAIEEDRNHNSVHRVLSVDETAEHELLVPKNPSDEQLQAELDQLVSTVTAEMKDSFKKNLKQTVTRMLGFSDRWNNGWEVDHCNGRTSEVTRMVTQDVHNFMQQEMSTYKQLLDPNDIINLRESIRKDFLGNIKHELRRHIHEEMHRQVKALVAIEVAKLISGQEFDLKKTCLDVLKYSVNVKKTR